MSLHMPRWLTWNLTEGGGVHWSVLITVLLVIIKVDPFFSGEYGFKLFIENPLIWGEEDGEEGEDC